MRLGGDERSGGFRFAVAGAVIITSSRTPLEALIRTRP